MVRPTKWRKVCQKPINMGFRPLDDDLDSKEIIKMTIGEYETVRLIDYEGLKQEDCAKRMNIGRTTVQGIYNDARKKIGEALVDNKVLIIEGGSYELCDGESAFCDHKYCVMDRTINSSKK